MLGQPLLAAQDAIADAFVPHPLPSTTEACSSVAHRIPSPIRRVPRDGHDLPAIIGSEAVLVDEQGALATASTSRTAGSRSTTGINGAHQSRRLQTSPTRSVGRARSKSISARACPSTNTTFSGVMSMCPTNRGGPAIDAGMPGGSGSSSCARSSGTPNGCIASSRRRTSRATEAMRSSSAIQFGQGRPATSPGMNDNVWRPWASIPRKRGAPSKSTPSRNRQHRFDEIGSGRSWTTHGVADPHQSFGDVATQQRFLRTICKNHRHDATGELVPGSGALKSSGQLVRQCARSPASCAARLASASNARCHRSSVYPQ